MNVAYMRLLSGRPEDLWRGRGPTRRSFAGCVRSAEKRSPPWIRARNSFWGGSRSTQTGMRAESFSPSPGSKILPAWRGMGIGTGLLNQAGDYLREHKTGRLKFGTSPLLTWNAALCMRHFGMRFSWKEGIRTPDGKPWPYVSCEWDVDDPLVKPPEAQAGGA